MPTGFRKTPTMAVCSGLAWRRNSDPSAMHLLPLRPPACGTPLNVGFVAVALAAVVSGAEPKSAPNQKDSAERDAARSWYASLPTAPKPELAKHGLVAEEI